MKLIIKNPAPTDWRQEKWGDFHFGRCLGKYLRRLGIDVDTDYYPDWETDKKADVVLVLRGKYAYKPVKKAGVINVMWNISHPESVDIEEYNSYDIVFVASNRYADFLQGKVVAKVYPLLQCTDTEEFCLVDPKNDEDRHGFIFVGNTREVERPCVIWTAEMGLPLQVWGRGWKKWIDARFIMGDYYENQRLGQLYSGAKVVLNDHWSDMKSYGFINNRVFDALACGLPIISDYHEELHKMFPEEILYYQNKSEFFHCVEKALLSYPIVKGKIDGLRSKICEEFTFERRAIQIIETLNK